MKAKGNKAKGTPKGMMKCSAGGYGRLTIADVRGRWRVVVAAAKGTK